MATPDERHSSQGNESAPHAPGAVTAEATPAAPTAAGVRVVSAGPTDGHSHAPATPAHSGRRWLVLGGLGVGLAVLAYFLVPWIILSLNTISTDDAYVNSHVTFVAPRVAGQVSKVLVDDNYRVKKGDLLVQIDKEPFEIQVNIRTAAVGVAEANLKAARAQVESQVAQARASRFRLEHAIEDVNNQIANLRAAVATYESKKATLELGRANLKRGEELAPSGGISKEDLDVRRQTVKVEAAAVDQALQNIFAIRVGLGLPEKPPEGKDLTYVPEGYDQTFSSVRQALSELLQNAARFGYFTTSWDSTPKQVLADFYKQNPQGNLDAIYAVLIPQAPAIKQAEAALMQAKRDLDQANLNLRYCDILSEIDGVVTRRNVNPGNNIQIGQSLMAVRSLTEIWVDANFKETQLADLRIGQRVVCDVDMYGDRKTFEGRITGFTMGTGSTLALLPPENATGNFVKIVQRLPVRIEFPDYDAEKDPLFVGISVEPHVFYKEAPTGPDAGKRLQPLANLPSGPTTPRP
jgi:membrane fusion protein, multidrug efflux system